VIGAHGIPGRYRAALAGGERLLEDRLRFRQETAAHIQGYRYNQWLFRIVLMALLVNFSKTIAGFFIDVGQVIMLTFVDQTYEAIFP